MEKKADIFVTILDSSKLEQLRVGLIEKGFELKTPQYTHFQAKKSGISVTFYMSGKLVVQGKQKHDFIIYYLEPEILNSTEYSYPHQNLEMHARIGIDEAGKGDFFGPLCVAGVYVDGESSINKLLKLGVKDSKKMKDSKILELAKKIKSEVPYSLTCLRPIKYNELYNKFKNLNSLLAWGHATCIEKLYESSSCKDVIIDQFASEHVVLNALRKKGLDLNLTQRHKGEEDVVVAAASILARAAFLDGIEALSEEFQTKLPLGVSPMVKQAARSFVFKNGPARLGEVAKLHFKTTNEVLEM